MSEIHPTQSSKIASIVNYGIRNSNNTISYLSGQLSFPIFFPAMYIYI